MWWTPASQLHTVHFMKKLAGPSFQLRASDAPLYAWAWQRAEAAYDAVTQRRWPEIAHPSGVMLQRGDVALLDAPLEYARFYGMDVEYTTSTTLVYGPPAMVVGSLAADAIGNAFARSRAEALARHQWREAQTARVIVTDRRMLIRTVDHWLTFDHGAVAQFIPVPAHWHLIVEYHGAAPLLLGGVPAPHAAVVLQSILQGPDSLAMHAAFAPFRQPRAASAASEPVRDATHQLPRHGDGFAAG